MAAHQNARGSARPGTSARSPSPAAIEVDVDLIGERYTIAPEVWSDASSPEGTLCVSCLEDRLHRRLISIIKSKSSEMSHAERGAEGTAARRAAARNSYEDVFAKAYEEARKRP